MTTSNPPDLSLLTLPRDEDGPVFAEPWQAQAFALAVRLSEEGHFTWKEWAGTLAEELEVGDDGSQYYNHWLAALERLVVSKQLADPQALHARKEAWAEAYRDTPHGQPVVLSPPGSPLLKVTRADGVAKEIRLHHGHLYVCQGCCCGRTDKGFPPLPLEEFKRQWKDRGIRRRFHLTVSGCLGPCSLANVVLLQFHGRSVWLHSINQPSDVDLIYNYVERMLLAESFLPAPPELAKRQFQRYAGEETVQW